MLLFVFFLVFFFFFAGSFPHCLPCYFPVRNALLGDISEKPLCVELNSVLYPGPVRTDCCAMVIVVVNHCIVSSVACRGFARD